MIKNYDITSTDKNVYTEYNQIAAQQGLTQAQQYIQNNNYIEYALVAAYFNEILEVISSGDNNLQEFHWNEVLKYIGVPPAQWVRGYNYVIGDKVFLNSELDSQIYLCIKNINNSTNVNNQKYWLKISNYYTVDSLSYIYQQWIDRFKVIGNPEWVSTTTYYKNDRVSNSGNTYICIDNNENGTTAPLTDNTAWLKLELQGLKGTDSLGLVYGGQWVEGQNYDKNTLIIYNNGINELYVSLVNITETTVVPSESTEWLRVSSNPSSNLYIYPFFAYFSEPVAFWNDGSPMNRLVWHINKREFEYVTDNWEDGQIAWVTENQIQTIPVINVTIQDTRYQNYITVNIGTSYIDSITHTVKYVLNLTCPPYVFDATQVCNPPGTSIGYNLKVSLVGGPTVTFDNYQTQPLFPLVNCKYLIELQLNEAHTQVTGINNYQFVELPENSYVLCTMQANLSKNYVSSNWRFGNTSNTTYLNTILNSYYTYYAITTTW